jgi:hypothetical protein
MKGSMNLAPSGGATLFEAHRRTHAFIVVLSVHVAPPELLTGTDPDDDTCGDAASKGLGAQPKFHRTKGGKTLTN